MSKLRASFQYPLEKRDQAELGFVDIRVIDSKEHIEQRLLNKIVYSFVGCAPEFFGIWESRPIKK